MGSCEEPNMFEPKVPSNPKIWVKWSTRSTPVSNSRERHLVRAWSATSDPNRPCSTHSTPWSQALLGHLLYVASRVGKDECPEGSRDCGCLLKVSKDLRPSSSSCFDCDEHIDSYLWVADLEKIALPTLQLLPWWDQPPVHHLNERWVSLSPSNDAAY